jgi:nitroreductase
MLLSRPVLVPSYYKRYIRKVEDVIDSQNIPYSGADPEYLLLLTRKFAHILDKGLHRSDIEKGHSHEIYTELSRILNAGKGDDYLNDPSVRWAREKLNYYEGLQAGIKTDPLSEDKERILPRLDFGPLSDHIRSRRSNRAFLEKTVEKELLIRALETINWTTTSCNKQPARVFATVDPDLAAACARQCKGATGFSKFIPAFLAFTADLRGYSMPDEMFLPYIDVSLCAQNVLLSAHSLGLSTTALSWAQSSEGEEAKLRNLLNIPDHCLIIFNAITGYPSKEYCIPARKPVDKTLSFAGKPKA